MKKRLMIIILAAIVVLAGVTTAIFIFKNKSEHKNQIEEYSQALKNSAQYTSLITATNCEQLRSMAEEYDIQLVIPQENRFAVNNVTVNEKVMNITYDYNEDDIEMVRWSYDICSQKDIDTNDEQSMEILRMDICDISTLLGDILESAIDTVNLYSPDGFQLDSDALENYKKLLTGEAIYDLMIQDQEGMIWNARTNLSEDGVLSVHFYRSLNKEFNKTRTPDIILE